ncbi:hypothetical protein KY333_04940 [Candidatus Woesearchaeota archaeon]|nr:hypothetical protein [Candidatus Woesearchaeota archaeon]
MISPLAVMFILVMTLLLFAMIVWVIIILTHPHRIEICEEMDSGNKYNIKRCKIRRDKDKGTNKIVPLFSRELIRIRGGVYSRGRNLLFKVFKDKNGLYHPVSVKKGIECPDHGDALAMHAMQTRETINTYDNPGFWKKYGHIITFMSVMVICTLLLIVYGYYFKQMIIQGGGQVASGLNNAAGAIKGLIGGVAG